LKTEKEKCFFLVSTNKATHKQRNQQTNKQSNKQKNKVDSLKKISFSLKKRLKAIVERFS
jgi:hypothetical protein